MPRHRRGDRHAGIHQRQRCAADRGHGTGSVRFQNVADHAQRVGERLLVGNHGRERALGQRAVADFAAARAAHEADFADAERREVVVQHEALGGFAGLQQLDALLVVLGAQRDRHQRLRFAAREQRRAVRARQHAGFDGDLAGSRRTRGHPDGGGSSASRRGRCAPSARRTASWRLRRCCSSGSGFEHASS